MILGNSGRVYSSGEDYLTYPTNQDIVRIGRETGEVLRGFIREPKMDIF
mgnify:FL=1